MELGSSTRYEPVSQEKAHLSVDQEHSYPDDDSQNESNYHSSLERRNTSEKEKTALSKSIIKKQFAIHLIALAATVAILQLSFRKVFWFDSGAWDNKWYNLGLSQDELMNGLQFAAKLHEIFIVGSLTAVVMHVVRRRLLSGGLPFGLLTSGYNATSVEFLFSKSMWSPGWPAWQNWSSFLSAICLALVIIYASLVGPSSAIAVIPNLDWWPVSDPFSGQLLTTYLNVSLPQLYPQHVELNPDAQLDDCNTYTENPFCPNGGFDDLLLWAISYAKENAGANMSMVEQTSGTRRQLISQNASIAAQNQSASDEQGSTVAIATTVHQSVIMLMGLFWDFVSVHSTGEINNIIRPLLGFSDNSPVRSPLVQVQCHWYDYGDILNQNATAAGGVSFPTRALNNFTTPYYADNSSSWAVNQSFYNFSGSGNSTNFTWVDLSSSYAGVSLGAVVKLPYTIGGGDDDDVSQESWILPCTIDARWVNTELMFDPKNDNLIHSNITNPADFAAPNDDPGTSPDSSSNQDLELEVSDAIVIDIAWADILNTPGIIVNDISHTAFNTTMIQALLLQFIIDKTLPNETSYSYFEAPPIAFVGETTISTSTIANAAAVTVENILAMTIAEGLSRSSYSSAVPYIILNDDPNNIMSYNLSVQAGSGAGSVQNHTNPALLRDWTPFQLTVQRFGYGYAWGESRTVQFGITILLIYITIAVVYIIYSIYFFGVRGRVTGKPGWQSSAWGGAAEMIALALVTPAAGARHVLGSVGAGVEEGATWKKVVRVSERPGRRLELMVDDGQFTGSRGGDVVVGKKYQ